MVSTRFDFSYPVFLRPLKETFIPEEQDIGLQRLMASHKHKPEGGAVKGFISCISLLHSIWDPWVPSQLPRQGSSQQAAGRHGKRQTWGTQERQSWCSKGLAANLSLADAKPVLLHQGWEGVAWLSRKKVWWLVQRKLCTPKSSMPIWRRDFNQCAHCLLCSPCVRSVQESLQGIAPLPEASPPPCAPPPLPGPLPP